MIGQRFRIKIAFKFLVMYLVVGLAVSLTIGAVAYGAAAKSMIRGAYAQIQGVSGGVVSQIMATNERHFQTLHALAEISIIKDESISLADKQKELVNVTTVMGENCENVAFY